MAVDLSIPQPPIFQFGHLKIVFRDADSLLLLIKAIMQVIQLFLRYSLQDFALLHGYVFFVSWLPSNDLFALTVLDGGKALLYLVLVFALGQDSVDDGSLFVYELNFPHFVVELG